MKLHVKFEMDIDEEPIRGACHTANAQDSAIALRSMMMLNMDEAIAEIGATNVSVTVDAVEEE